MQDVGGNLIEYLSRIAFPKISIIDVIQIALIAFFVYQFMIWIKYTHAHNTPLHDGAVIVRENRIVAATCYLPLSDNMELSKQLGTRHRAGVGISEQTDSVTIIVSEETGQVSVAQNGRLIRGVSSAKLREILVRAQNKQVVDNSKLRHLLKGRMKHEEEKNH